MARGGNSLERSAIYLFRIYKSVILAQARTSGRAKLNADMGLQQREGA
jgi:hypothetical protein